jgi:hypothetical protein
MDTKSKFSPNGTYVLDAEDIEQLDQLSLTSVVSALGETVTEDDPAPAASSIPEHSVEGDTTINKILGAQSASESDQLAGQPDLPSESEAAQTAGDLIAPELLFPELTSGRKR